MLKKGATALDQAAADPLWRVRMVSPSATRYVVREQRDASKLIKLDWADGKATSNRAEVVGPRVLLTVCVRSARISSCRQRTATPRDRVAGDTGHGRPQDQYATTGAEGRDASNTCNDCNQGMAWVCEGKQAIETEPTRGRTQRR